jgi:G:T-mismatch repair DNA endonuclease (very short patch repair protein)
MRIEQEKDGVRILHGRNGKERQLPELPGVRVDGLCEETCTVYEFMGCYWHGHPCMPFRDVATLSGGENLAERYEQTLAGLERLAAEGYAFRVQWECEFDPPDSGVDDREAEASRPLRTRDALYGERTEAMRLHHRIRVGEETLRYVDVWSLYPWICKYIKFPVGHPTIHLDCDDIPAALAKEGLVRCTAFPPRNLYHPLLPYRCRGRLLFCLCRFCVEVGSKEQCCHVSAADRVLSATWVVDEVRLAV